MISELYTHIRRCTGDPIALSNRLDDFGQKLIDLLLAAASELRRVDRGFDVDAGECLVAFQSGDEIVFAALFLHDRRGGLAVLADSFVEFLAVAAGGDGGHEDVFGRHEGQFFAQVFGDDLRVDRQAACDVLIEDQDGVDGQEGLRE